MNKNIKKSIILGGVTLASALSSQAGLVYITDFTEAYANTNDSTSFDGTTIATESWFGSSNGVGIAGGELGFNNGTFNRTRGSAVWLDASAFGAAGTINVEFDVTAFTAGSATSILFQTFSGNDLGGADTVSLDIHGGFSNGTTTTSSGIGSIAQIGGDQVIARLGNNQTLTFEYNGTDEFVALVFTQSTAEDDGTGTQTIGTASLDNLRVSTVPEPSSAALLGLGSLALMLRRRK